MEDGDKKKLQRNQSNIVDNMQDVSRVLDSLFEDRLVTAEFRESVMNPFVDRADKVRKILSYIPGKAKGYSGLIKALYLTENDGVLAALGESLEITDFELGQPLEFVPVASPPSDMQYNMKRNPRGTLLIIEVREFDDNTGMNTRRGSQLDFAALDALFKKLYFNVKHHLNPTAEEIQQCIRKYAAEENHASSDCAIVVVLSHGSEGHIYGKDGQPVSIENNIIAPILGCHNLKDKPKVFLFQACRSGPAMPLATNDLIIKKPLTSDVLIACATQMGESAHRSVDEGSWFIRSICTIFWGNAHTQDLLSMITMAYCLIKKKTESEKRDQIGIVESTLLKKVYFHPH